MGLGVLASLVGVLLHVFSHGYRPIHGPAIYSVRHVRPFAGAIDADEEKERGFPKLVKNIFVLYGAFDEYEIVRLQLGCRKINTGASDRVYLNRPLFSGAYASENVVVGARERDISPRWTTRRFSANAPYCERLSGRLAGIANEDFELGLSAFPNYLHQANLKVGAKLLLAEAFGEYVGLRGRIGAALRMSGGQTGVVRGAIGSPRGQSSRHKRGDRGDCLDEAATGLPICDHYPSIGSVRRTSRLGEGGLLIVMLLAGVGAALSLGASLTGWYGRQLRWGAAYLGFVVIVGWALTGLMGGYWWRPW